MRLPFVLAWLAHFARPAAAIFPEQLGEFDWKIEGIGAITQSVFHAKRVIVATDAGVVASLNVASGQPEWRVVLPRHAQVEQLVFVPWTDHTAAVDQPPVYVYSTDATVRGAGSVQAFHSASGDLLWEHFFAPLESDRATPNNGTDTEAVDMQVSEARNALLILRGGALSVLSTTAGALLWSWRPDASSGVRLASLVVPEQPPLRQGKGRVAVGCVLDRDGATCGKVALVTADFDLQTCAVQLQPALAAPWRSLRASVAEQGAFGPSDCVLGASSAYVHVLSLTAGKDHRLPWPEGPAWPGNDKLVERGPVEARTFAMLFGETGAMQVASRCSQGLCVLYRLGDTGGAPGPGLQRLATCQGSAAALLLQRSSTASSTVRHMGCALAAAPGQWKGKEACSAGDKACPAAAAPADANANATVVTVRAVRMAGAGAVDVDEFIGALPTQSFAALRHASLFAFKVGRRSLPAPTLSHNQYLKTSPLTIAYPFTFHP